LKRGALLLLLAATVCAQERAPKIIWREPKAMTVQDWVCGPGGCDNTPAPPFELKKEDPGGTNPKVQVRDAKGREWSVKFGGEVIPECFGSRFANALGYFAEPTYFVGSGKLEKMQTLKRSRRFIRSDGTFARARFELRGQSDLKFLEGQQWGWSANPFVGTHELAGLKIVLMLLSNWDAKDTREGDDANTGVFRVTGGGRDVLFYGVFDWGASLGRWGRAMRRDQSDCAGFAWDTPGFFRIGGGNRLEWGYDGKHAEDMKNVTIDDVRWLLPYLDRVQRAQLVAGLKASGATERQAGCWAGSLESRIQQLRQAAPGYRQSR
jgi:hypothetical protein